jgi:hypothetical protein
VQLPEKALDRVGFLVGLRDMLCQGLGGALPVVVIGQMRSGGTDDPGLLRHLAVAKPVVQRGQQFPQRKVAGGAEHDAVENGNGYDLRHPGAPGRRSV